jgi:hypothetical protein
MKDNIYSEMVIICSVCEKEEELHWNLKCNKECVDNKMCFSCNFWRNHHASHLDASLRIDGHHYMDCGSVENPNQFGVGHGGRRIKIRKFDGSIIETNNLWHQGAIPSHWKNKLPDNAEFVRAVPEGLQE